jgi:hypothetical protein
MKLRLAGAILSALGLAPVAALRFLPKTQRRTDTRGRTVATYESLTDAVHDLRDIYDGKLTPSKETDHGSYYLAIEIRSTPVQKNGSGRHPKINTTVPLPFPVALNVPEIVPGASAVKSHPTHPEKAADVERAGTGEDRGVHQPNHRSHKVAQPEQPVGEVKVDLSKIGLR